jgi:hypothetical protein
MSQLITPSPPEMQRVAIYQHNEQQCCFNSVGLPALPGPASALVPSHCHTLYLHLTKILV